MGLIDGITGVFGGGGLKAGWDALSGGNGGGYNGGGPGPTYSDYGSLFKDAGNGGMGLRDEVLLTRAGDPRFKSNIDELKSRLDNIQLDKKGLEELRKRALATGDSESAKYLLEKQALDERVAGDKAVRGAQSAETTARGNLASSGGLSQGARERIAKDAMRNLTSAKQDVTLSGIGQRLGVRSQDEANRLDLLKMLPGAEIQALQPDLQKTTMWGTMADSEAGREQNLDLANRNYRTSVDQFNINTTMKIKEAEDAVRMKKYEEDMKKYAADRTANAQADSGKK